jgi:hypothetical protein
MVVLAAPPDGSRSIFLPLGERARTQRDHGAVYLGNLLDSEANALRCGRRAHHSVVVSIWIEHGLLFVCVKGSNFFFRTVRRE